MNVSRSMVFIPFHPKEWWRLGSFSQLHSWDGCDLNGQSPFKPCVSPLRWVPGADNPASIQIDLAHTFSMGFGKDFCAGAIIALCHIGMFGRGGAIGTKLDRAYNTFREWIPIAKQYSKISEFSLKVFKVSSLLPLLSWGKILFDLNPTKGDRDSGLPNFPWQTFPITG